MKFLLPSLLVSAAGAFLIGCSEPTPDLPRLEFPTSMPKELTIGDTTGALTVVKYSADPRGRETRTDDYLSFTFKSGDTTVIRVVQGRRLLGLKAGTSAITAEDDREDARTPSSLSVTVK